MIAHADEPMRSVLPATDVVRVSRVQSPAYREFDPLSEFILAPPHDPWRFLSGPEAASVRVLDHLGAPSRFARSRTPNGPMSSRRTDSIGSN